MPTTIDDLQIQINASAKTANRQIDTLIKNLNNLSGSLGQFKGNKITLVTKSISNIGSSGKQMKRALDSTATSVNRASKSYKGLASSIGKFYATYFMAIRGVKGLWRSIESTADYIEAYNYFNVALGKIGSDWSHQWEKYAEETGVSSAEEYADSFSKRLSEDLKKLSGITLSVDSEGQGLLTETGLKNLGLNIQEVTQYASQLASVTNSVGQTGEVSLAAASAFTKLGADISSLFNQDYSGVMKNLQSGLIGQSRALYKYGIDITNATLQTYAYELGLSKAVSEMTQAEKMQLRMIAILDQSKVAWGDLANTIASPSNMIRQFKNNLKELSMVLGQLFVPVLSKVLPVINGFTIAVKRLLTSIAGILGIKMDVDSFGKGFSGISEEIDGISDGFEDATASAKKFKSTTLGIDELNINAPQESSGSGASAVGGGIDLTDEILKATEEYQKVWNEAYAKMEDRVQQFANNIYKAFEKIENLIMDAKIGNWFAVGGDISDIIIGINNAITRAIANVDWQGIGNSIGAFLSGIKWSEILQSFGQMFWQGVNSAIELYASTFSVAPIETALLSAFGLVSFTGLGDVLKAKFTKTWSNLLKTGEGFGRVGEAVALAVGGAGTPLEALSVAFSGISKTALVAGGALTALVSGLGVVFATNEDVRESFKKAISAVKKGLQPAFEFLTKKVIPDVQKGFNRLMDVISPLTDFLSETFASVWMEIINPALSEFGTNILPKLTEVIENLWSKILVPVGSFLMSVLSPAIKFVSEVLKELWKSVIVPLAQTVGGALLGAFDGVSSVLTITVIPVAEKVIDVLTVLWKKVIEPIAKFVSEKFGEAFKNAFKFIGEQFDWLSGLFGGLVDFISGVFTGDWEKAWNGIVSVFDNIWQGIVGIAKAPLNMVINAINALISGVENTLNWFIEGINSISFGVEEWMPEIGGQRLSLDLDPVKFGRIERFEFGGFPTIGDLFFANERGIPELVGTMNGRPAVGSGKEITGISDAIYDTSSTEIELMREEISLLREILRKENVVNIGDRDIARANARGKKLLGYELVT